MLMPRYGGRWGGSAVSAWAAPQVLADMRKRGILNRPPTRQLDEAVRADFCFASATGATSNKRE